MRYELTIPIEDVGYLDSLAVALLHQGYAPYITFDGHLAITIEEEDLEKIKE